MPSSGWLLASSWSGIGRADVALIKGIFSALRALSDLNCSRPDRSGAQPFGAGSIVVHGL
jgi:hypothetical protein